MELNIFKTVEEQIAALANYVIDASKTAIMDHDRFDFVLSGGSSPKRLYELLTSDKYKKRIDWSRTYFFFGDERFVPAGDEERNSLMAKESLFDHVNISDDQIFKVDTSGSPEEAAKKYEMDIEVHFGKKPIRFDLVLLGLGDDAHTASLFPGTSILNEKEAGIRSVYLEDKQVYRISMTYPLINQAKEIAFLAFGENKAEAAQHVLEGEKDTSKFPAQLIRSEMGSTEWFLDKKAASKLTKPRKK